MEKTWSSNYGYFGLNIIAFVTFLITFDFGATGTCLALALCFQPFDGLPYKDWSTTQKGLILLQLALSAAFAGVYLYQTVAS